MDSSSSKIEKQTEVIIKTLCQEIKESSDTLNQTSQESSASFAHKLLTKKKKDKVIKELVSRSRSNSLSDDVPFDMDGFSNMDISAESEISGLNKSQSESSFDDTISEEEAIQALIAAIERMAEKLNKNPKVQQVFQQKGMSRNSVSFLAFKAFIKVLVEELAPGLTIDSWGNAVFLIILAMKVTETKSYPIDIFKQFVYDKIVPWVQVQPQGWASARYDEKIGVAVENEAHKTIPIPRSTTPQSEVSESPSSLMNWFSFSKRWSYG